MRVILLKLYYAIIRPFRIVYWYIVRPRFEAIKCVVLHEDKMLMVRHAYGDRRWDFVGGICNRDESLVEAVRREVCEEVGVVVADVQQVGQRTIHQGRVVEIYAFIAQARGVNLTVSQIELDGAAWFPVDTPPTDMSHSGSYLYQTFKEMLH